MRYILLTVWYENFYFCFYVVFLGCSSDIDYLPGFKFVDSQRFQIKSNEFESPLIVYLVEGYDLEITDDRRFMREIREAVTRGCSINKPNSGGLSPLNTAIFFRKPKLLVNLLSLG